MRGGQIQLPLQMQSMQSDCTSAIQFILRYYTFHISGCMMLFGGQCYKNPNVYISVI